MGHYKQSQLEKRDSRGGTQPKAGTGSKDFPTVRWVRFTFTPEQKERIRATELDIVRAIDNLAAMVETGHKLSFSPKNSEGFCGASIFGHTDECPNKGFGLSGEGGDFYAALKSLYWKLEFLDGDFRIPDLTGIDDFR